MPTTRLTIKAPSTTGNHISLVEGEHSLEVKGDLARKVAGALGIKVEGDIVLESSGSISLKAGGSFIVIQAGGVDIVGPKINLNGGGSPGTPVGILQPGVPQGLFDEQVRVLGTRGNPWLMFLILYVVKMDKYLKVSLMCKGYVKESSLTNQPNLPFG